MTTANKITILRILLVPLFIVMMLYFQQTGRELFHWLALGSFGLAAFSDGLDGYIARRYNQRSVLGAILDPLADKLLLVSGLVLLSLESPHMERLPLWLTVTVFSRDFILLLGTVVIHYVCGKITVQPHLIGKVATVAQMVCIFWTLLRWNSDWLEFWALTATLTTMISAAIYLRDGIQQLGTSPSSGALPPS